MSDKVIYTKENLVWVKNIFRENEKKCCLFADNTCICISLLHKPILYHLKDQTFLLFSKHTDYYKMLWFFKLFPLFRYFVFAHFFSHSSFENKGKHGFL